MRKWVPHKYQTRAVDWVCGNLSSALFLDPGLGKTAIVLEALRQLALTGDTGPTLVVGPLRVIEQVWSTDSGGEIGKWAQFRKLRVTRLHGPKKMKALDEEADIYTINYEGVPWLAESGGLQHLLSRGCNKIVFDELSKMRHARTRRFKTIKKFLSLFDRRIGMTGSPCANRLLDLFGQIYCLDLGQRLGRYYTHYRNRYFDSTGYRGYVWVPKAGAKDLVSKQIEDLALAMRAEDYLDMPELLENDVVVDLPPAARKIYDCLETELIAEVNENLVVASTAAVALGKCRQVAGGTLYRQPDCACGTIPCTCDKTRLVEVIHDAKLSALKDLVDELQGAPLLVLCEYQHEIERVSKMFDGAPVLSGKTRKAQADIYLSRWNAGDLPVLIGQPAAMGHGLNLQAGGSHMCWYTLTWDFELYDQAIRRLYRQGQESTVIVHRLLAHKTVDYVVASALRRKAAGQGALFDALSDYARSVSNA